MFDRYKLYVSYLVAYGDPLLAEVVPPAEDLEVVAVGHQLLDVVVDLFWLLALAPAVAEDDVLGHSLLEFGCVSLDSH